MLGSSKSMQRVINAIPSLGLSYIAAVAKQHGYPVSIIDCTLGMGHTEVIERVLREKPDIVGLTCTTPTYPSVVKVALDIKAFLKDTVIVIGGAHVTAVKEEAITGTCIDVGVIGEGEETFLELIQHLETKGKDNLEQVKGLIFKNEEKIVKTGIRGYIKNLDSIPFPARHLLPPLSDYRPTPASYRYLPLGVMITSRGCPTNCTFCDRAVFGKQYRARSADNVMEEIKELIYRYGAREIRFFDDTLTINKSRLFEICSKLQAIQKKIKIPWTCLTKVNAVTKKMLTEMKKAGCWQVLYGIESGDPAMLKRLKKGTTIEENSQAIRWAKELGLSIRADFVVGTPGETLESLQKTLEFAIKSGVDYAHFNKFIPLPGTEIYQQLKAEGYAFDFSKSYSILDHSALPYVPNGIKRDEFIQFLNYANKKFYLRPSYILKRLVSIRTWDEFAGQVKGALAIRGL